MGSLAYHRYAAEFETETARLAGVASTLEPQATVPTCPEWTVRDLVSHVGTGHRMATQIVTERLLSPPRYAVIDAPQEPAAWADWLASGARALLDSVREAGPEQPVWTWQADRPAGFWVRRMLHDEVVHRYDAELAAGRLGEVAPDLAADGVSDLLDCIVTLSPPEVEMPAFGLAGTGQALRFVATDQETAWFVERTPAGVRWRHGDGPAEATVFAPARELLLVLNRRLDPAHDGVQITGDRAVFQDWLEHSDF
jgi:uncharacterized protein (TIGR03083 family)